jgi:hypothetical protein
MARLLLILIGVSFIVLCGYIIMKISRFFEGGQAFNIDDEFEDCPTCGERVLIGPPHKCIPRVHEQDAEEEWPRG